MKVLALDISTKTGYCVLEGKEKEIPLILETGIIENKLRILEHHEKYPYNYLLASFNIVGNIFELLYRVNPDYIVVEETNKSSKASRYSQKILEFIHSIFIHELYNIGYKNIFYISSSEWRKIVGIIMTKEDKKNNAKINKLKKEGKSKKDSGLKGKVNKKHLAVRKCNELFNLNLKLKQNDIADACLLGTSFFLGASYCNGEL